MAKSKLLIDEYPLMVLPGLAKAIGLNEAIILQQIHYWLTVFEQANDGRHWKEGRWWVYNTMADWQKNFPWWSLSTIERTLRSLRARGLVLASGEMNARRYDRTLWYTIDYAAVESLTSDCGDPLQQNAEMDLGNLGLPIPKTNTETVQETTIPADAGIPEPEPVSEKPTPSGEGSGETERGLGVSEYNLDEVWFRMEDAGGRKEDATAPCERCGATVTQQMNLCPDCGQQIIWRYSPTWKRLYGNPDQYKRRVEAPDLAPKTPLEVTAARVFGTGGQFSNITQAKRFRTLARKYPEGFVEMLIGWAKRKHVGFENFETAVRNSNSLRDWEEKKRQDAREADERARREAKANRDPLDWDADD